MSTIKIEGNNNFANTGIIYGSCFVNCTIINLEFNNIDLYKAMNEKENEKSLVNMTEAQKKLAEAIDKFAQAELTRSEADKLRAKADENNSLANLNYSKIMLEDREIIKQLVDKLK